jgi:hypothetical protein
LAFDLNQRSRRIFGPGTMSAQSPHCPNTP